MDILITNPDGKVATIAFGDLSLAQALSRVFGIGVTELHTARCIEANHALYAGQVVEHKGWKFEPLETAEVVV